VHLVPAAELPGDGVEAKADGLTEEIPELVYRSGSRSWFRGGRQLDKLYRDRGALLRGGAVCGVVLSVPLRAWRGDGGFRGFAARAAAAALGAA